MPVRFNGGYFQDDRHGCRYLEFTSNGNQFLTIENEIMKIVFWMNKGADIVELRHKSRDIDVMWRNPMPMPVAGTYISPANPAAGNFFDYYPGGWQTVFPNAHLATNGYKNAPLGTHGEVCLQAWSYEVKEHSNSKLVIDMRVRTGRTPFLLTRTFTVESGQPSFRLKETIVNEGNEAMHYSYGHHPVFGAPFVQEGCRIDVPDGSIAVVPEQLAANTARYKANQRQAWPYLQTMDGTQADASIVLGPSAGSADSFHVEPSQGWAALRNPNLDLGVGLAWDVQTFPYLWMWQAYCGNPGYPFYKRNYNVALEPFSVPAQSLVESIAQGHAQLLEAGTSTSTDLLFMFTSGLGKITHIDLHGNFQQDRHG